MTVALVGLGAAIVACLALAVVHSESAVAFWGTVAIAGFLGAAFLWPLA
ncbi:hypothetical protein J3996_gp86 [Mycobacterium phage Laurie]|uniref:Uncharacterized protein n=1 Tax=Mycobacterium phage Laurie TaxID=1874015 RepID=A0A1B2IHV5_9CAUD|nr:hypothetical protein J3996_gp86 [Mycobacterium phage Laurie]ANZ52380.1 hypothetical protein SEA_LAURIE_86 [Mycobacterium phage Laurie]